MWGLLASSHQAPLCLPLQWAFPQPPARALSFTPSLSLSWAPVLEDSLGVDINEVPESVYQWVLRNSYLVSAITYFYKMQKGDFFPCKVKCLAQKAGVYFCQCRRGNWRPWHVSPLALSHGNCPLVCKDSLER